MSCSLWSHGLQHSRLPCPSLSPGVCSNSSPLSRWCHPTISSSVTLFSSCLQSFPGSEASSESALRTRWPKYWSFTFSISPSNEHSELVSFRIDWFDLFAIRDSRESFSSTTTGKNQFLFLFKDDLITIYYGLINTGLTANSTVTHGWMKFM